LNNLSKTKRFIIKCKLFISDVKFYIGWSLIELLEEKDIFERVCLLFFKYLNPFYMVWFIKRHHAILNSVLKEMLGVDILDKERAEDDRR